MLRQLIGKKTNRKIIVIESDDWGSFRFKNKAVRDFYMKNPQPGQWMHYNDCFESYEDLKALDDVLKSVKDIHGNPVKFTLLFNPANPDFKKIEESNYKTYHYESFKQTLRQRDDGALILEWYNNAITNQIIEVGFHGREHLHVNAWMSALQEGDKCTINGLKHRIWGQARLYSNEKRLSFRSNFLIDDIAELKGLQDNIVEGIKIMNSTFVKKITYFLPPEGAYHLELNKTLVSNGIKYVGLPRLHNNPLDHKWYQKKLFWLGKKTKEGLTVITRNVMFEPCSPQSGDWVNFAMTQIETAFKYKNPAVISTHRANYVSSLIPENRTNGLKQLRDLLSKITQKWPDVEFMTSSELGSELL